MNWRPGTILGAVLGSQAQGFATSDSDTDYGAVFVGDNTLCGFREPVQTYQDHDPDMWSHELGKFCKLAMACNPTILELLFAPHHECVGARGLMLVNNRDAFLSVKRVRDAYQGYATSQVSRALKDETIKPRRHALRLLWQCEQTLLTGELPVYVPKPVRLKILEAARVDEKFTHMADQLRASIESITDPPLPDYPDEDRIIDMIYDIRNTVPWA